MHPSHHLCLSDPAQARPSPVTPPIIDIRNGLTAYSTDVIFLPEPNAFECVFSAHLYATAVSAEVQGIDLTKWVA